MKCAHCGTGSMVETTTSTCLHRDTRVAKFLNVPALTCEECGEPEFSAEVARRLSALFEGDEPATTIVLARVYDFARPFELGAPRSGPDITGTEPAPRLADEIAVLPESYPDLTVADSRIIAFASSSAEAVGVL